MYDKRCITADGEEMVLARSTGGQRSAVARHAAAAKEQGQGERIREQVGQEFCQACAGVVYTTILHTYPGTV